MHSTATVSDAAKLLTNTAHFHLANRGLAADKAGSISIDISIGNHTRRLRLRTGRIGDLFILYEILAFEAYSIAPTLVAPHDVETIVDCGANIGIASLYFASAYPAARIYSVEADPENFAMLKLNTMSEPRIVPIHGCIVSEPQATVAFDNRGPGWSCKVGQSDQISGQIEVTAITLDALLTNYSIVHVDLLKMDIEGAEREVFARGQYLSKARHIIAELHGDYSFADFSAAVAESGLSARLPGKECKMVTAHRLWSN